MKRLGRNERIGAAVLAAVSLAIVLCAFLSRQCRRGDDETDAVLSSLRELTEICGSQTDSLSGAGGKSVGESVRNGSAGDSDEGSKRRSTRHKKGTPAARRHRSSPSAPPRDFLKEKIPVREDPDTCCP